MLIITGSQSSLTKTECAWGDWCSRDWSTTSQSVQLLCRCSKNSPAFWRWGCCSCLFWQWSPWQATPSSGKKNSDICDFLRGAKMILSAAQRWPLKLPFFLILLLLRIPLKKFISTRQVLIGLGRKAKEIQDDTRKYSINYPNPHLTSYMGVSTTAQTTQLRNFSCPLSLRLHLHEIQHSVSYICDLKYGIKYILRSNTEQQKFNHKFKWNHIKLNVMKLLHYPGIGLCNKQ